MKLDFVGRLTMPWGTTMCNSLACGGSRWEFELQAPPWLEVEDDGLGASSSNSSEVKGWGSSPAMISSVGAASSSFSFSLFLLLPLFFLSSPFSLPHLFFLCIPT